jgi:hypothetical protein
VARSFAGAVGGRQAAAADPQNVKVKEELEQVEAAGQRIPEGNRK